MAGKWFQNSLSFSCTACGKCCKGATSVYVNAAESRQLADQLKMPIVDFLKSYVEERENTLMSLKSKPGGVGCIFLQNNKCSVYDSRPTQCRTYPFWPDIVMGEAEWKAEASSCEGIKVDSRLSSDVMPDYQVIHQLLLHQLHDKGLGVNWTHDESSDYLKETSVTEPELIDEFIGGFFGSIHSKIVYESAALRVVDVTLNTKDGVEDDSSGDNTTDSSSAVQIARRLEFIDSPRLNQTEVLYHSTMNEKGEKQQKFNFLDLQMPLHRLMSCLGSYVVDLATSSKTSNILVIGGGGCALPMHWFQKHGKHADTLIDVVEMSQEVVDVAVEYFGVAVSDPDSSTNGVRIHTIDGLSFLLQQHKAQLTIEKVPYQVVYLDAAEGCGEDDMSDVRGSSLAGGDEGAAGDELRCPPISLLSQNSVRAMHYLCTSEGVSGGAVIVNVRGSSSWKEHVVMAFTGYYATEDTEQCFPVAIRCLIQHNESTDGNNDAIVGSVHTNEVYLFMTAGLLNDDAKVFKTVEQQLKDHVSLNLLPGDRVLFNVLS